MLYHSLLVGVVEREAPRRELRLQARPDIAQHTGPEEEFRDAHAADWQGEDSLKPLARQGVDPHPLRVPHT